MQNDETEIILSLSGNQIHDCHTCTRPPPGTTMAVNINKQQNNNLHSYLMSNNLLYIFLYFRMGYSYTIVCGASASGTPPRYEVHGGGAPRLLTEGELLALVKGDVENASVQCRG